MFGKKYLVYFIVLTFVVSMFFLSKNSAAAIVDKSWTGVWESAHGEVVSVTEKDGFLDIFGKDSISIYNCAGIVEGTAAMCYGNGVQHTTNLRFIYRSQLKLSADGQSLEESWEVGFATDKEIKWLKGATTFKRTKLAGK